MESNDIGLWLEQSRGPPFLNNSITFAILQSFGNYLGVKERFTKMILGKRSAEFFTIGVGKLLWLDDLLLEKHLIFLIIWSGVIESIKTLKWYFLDMPQVDFFL